MWRRLTKFGMMLIKLTRVTLRVANEFYKERGVPPGFQTATFFLLPELAFIPTFMMNFSGKIPIFNILPNFSKSHTF